MSRKVGGDVTSALFLAAERMKFHRDRDLHKLPDYKVGDFAWLDAKNIATTQQTRKLAHRRIGPFEVARKVGPPNYELDLPSRLKIHSTFYVGLLSPAPTSQIPGRNFPKPPPVKVQGEEEWEVDEITNSRIHRNKLQHLVKWKGFHHLTTRGRHGRCLECIGTSQGIS